MNNIYTKLYLNHLPC